MFSIKNQTYSDFEVIVIDDSSDQGTVQSYENLWAQLDHRFTLIRLGGPGQKRLGPSSTRNHGIRLAQGELLAFCDDDDFWIDNRHLTSVSAAFDAFPTLDVYIANQIAVTSAGVTKDDWLPHLTHLLGNRQPDTSGPIEVTVEDLTESNGFAHLNMLTLRKSIAATIGGFWERTNYEEDRDFFWRALDQARTIVYTCTPAARHNIPDPSRVANLSTQTPQLDRWLLSTYVSQHIFTSVRNPLIAALALRYEGDVLRKIAVEFNAQKRLREALQYGVKALASRFSIKWVMYVLYLSLRRFALGNKA